MKIQSPEQSIIFVISYFDVFDYPPTFFEVWRYLFGFKAPLDQVISQLDELIRRGKIEMKNGFYFLPGKSHLVDFRQDKYDISEKNWRKAITAIKIINHLPFIKMVAVVNSLSLFNCDKNSDIDLLIVSKKGKIWTVRFLSTVLLQMLGLRRHGKKISRRICLSFYISEEKMDLNYIAKDGLGFFVAFWLAQSAPIVNHERTFEKFREQNKWIHHFLPNAGYNVTDYYINFRTNRFTKRIRGLMGFIFGANQIENILRKLQRNKIVKTQERIGNPESVIFDDHILKFHATDMRLQYKQKLVESLKKSGIFNK